MPWNAPLNEATERRLGRLTDLGERTVSIVLFSGLAVRVIAVVASRPADLIILASEGLVVLFMVIRKRPMTVSTHPMDWFTALAGTTAPMLVAPGGRPLTTPALGFMLVVLGLLFGMWGKLTLRRSFGLAAANRGVVDSGAYYFVRHPIYAGYVLTYVGFFLNNPTLRNGALYALSIVLMVMRIGAEEKVLRLDPKYAAYVKRIRYRVAPGLY